ncbi:MAG: tyrosine-type recombinase/integrase [Candidatus Hodarchaeota archaeon]
MSEIQKYLEVLRAAAPKLVQQHEELFVNYFMDNLQLDASTLRRYAYVLRIFLRYLEEKSLALSDISVSELNFFYLLRLKECLRKTVNNQFIIVFSFLKYLYWQEIISDKSWRTLEMQKSKYPKARGSISRPILEYDEVALVLRSLDDERAKAVIWILFEYGLRPQELADLKDEDVDLITKTLVIRESKHHKTREIPIPDSHIPEWRSWLFRKQLSYPGNPYVIPNSYYPQRGLSVVSIERLVKKASPILNKHVHPYMLRRSVATLAREQGVSREALAGILGHESPSTTDVYVQERSKTIRREWVTYKESGNKEE